MLNSNLTCFGIHHLDLNLVHRGVFCCMHESLTALYSLQRCGLFLCIQRLRVVLQMHVQSGVFAMVDGSGELPAEEHCVAHKFGFKTISTVLSAFNVRAFNLEQEAVHWS